MARSTKYAVLICSICSVITVIGIIAGIYFKMPVLVIAGLLPAVVYEIYRTEGVSTIWASWGMLVMLLIEAVLIIKKIDIDIARFVSEYIPGLPALDIKLGGPVIMAYFSYLLIRRTAGIYTKWLAVVIIVGALGLFYALDPSLFKIFAGEGLREGLKEGLERIPVK